MDTKTGIVQTGSGRVWDCAGVVELVDTRDLTQLSTRLGNHLCESAQIRGNLSGSGR